MEIYKPVNYLTKKGFQYYKYYIFYNNKLGEVIH